VLRTALRAEAAPITVRIAGALVGVQGLAGLVFAVALLVRAVGVGSKAGSPLYGEAAYFVVIAAAVVAVAIGLVTGRRWARTPAVVIQILMLGVAWYTIGSSGQPVAGTGVGVLSAAVVVLVFTAKGRAWAIGEWPPGNPES
jgi:hypothetical protein